LQEHNYNILKDKETKYIILKSITKMMLLMPNWH